MTPPAWTTSRLPSGRDFIFRTFCGIMQRMYTRDNRFVRILTIALIVCFALVVVQQVVIMIVGGRTAQAQGDLSSLQSQVADAQSQNSQMQQQYDEKLIEWRNVLPGRRQRQGRLPHLRRRPLQGPHA